ncbi:MAG: hypothetical protein GX589_04285 [Deltaproteobacteria bacterium]|nr:hypothetical protein [Deltaproteobacteria bacterium]
MAGGEVKKGMSREEAGKLYEQLRKNMESKFGKGELDSIIQKEKQRVRREQAAAKTKVSGTRPTGVAAAEAYPAIRRGSGAQAAMLFVVFFAVMKMGISLMEASGIASVSNASASVVGTAAPGVSAGYSREEAKVLTALDERRVKLEERSAGLDRREAEMERRDREFAARLTQIRDLTERLKSDRLQNDHRKNAQLDQLANVYGSMNPAEAAQLMDQLDVTIALSLIERMPEKRIGQILSLMSPERALTMTRMLSNKQ